MTIKKAALLAIVPILLLGAGVYLGIQFFPAIWRATPVQPLPTITVEAMFPGASASVVAETVAGPIEQQVNGVEQMVCMRSRCGSDGSYILIVTFQRGANLDLTQVVVENRVRLAEMARLPGVSDILVVGRHDPRTYVDFHLNQLATHDISVNEAAPSSPSGSGESGSEYRPRPRHSNNFMTGGPYESYLAPIVALRPGVRLFRC